MMNCAVSWSHHRNILAAQAQMAENDAASRG